MKSDESVAPQATGQANVARLRREWQNSVSKRDANYWSRMRLNHDARYCVWAGQSDDGRKWRSAANKEPFPWRGAADSRIHLVDMYVRQDVALLMQIWTTNRVLVRATKPGHDAGWAHRMTSLLRWLVYSQMEELEDEAELVANLYRERGAAAVLTLWDREEQLAPVRLTLTQIGQAAQQAAALMARGASGSQLQLAVDLPALVMDPATERDAAGLLQGVALLSGGELSETQARRAIRELRQEGETKILLPEVVRDQPRCRAMAWNQDIIVPPECADIQESRVVFVVERLSEAALRSRARQAKWDGNWLDWVVQTQRGVTTWSEDAEAAAFREASPAIGDDNREDLFEVVTAFERLSDEDGVPGIWVTVFSPGNPRRERIDAPNLVAQHELLDHAHGRYPITVFQTERRSRMVDDARGAGEMGFTWQAAMKRQWDARSDRSDLATLPPYFYPAGEEPDAWGPGVGIPTMQPGSFGFFDGPKWDLGSKEFEATVRQFADQFFGRTTAEGERSIESQVMQADMVRGWLKGWRRVYRQVLALEQQYAPDQMFYRVVGGEQGRALSATREEIQGQFDIELRFNTNDLDTEYIAQKIEMLKQALEMDANGRIDRDEALVAALELIEPSYAERLIKPGEGAAMQEIEDEQTALAKLLLGIAVDVKPGQAHAMRKQVLTKLLATNPRAQQMAMSDPNVMELIQRRFKQLDFQIQQKMVNPEIGRRLGTKPNPQLNPTP